MIIRSKAPLRISFSGGGTDVLPYLAERGGVVLNATIDHFAYASMRLCDEPTVTVRSLDYDMTVKHHITETLPYDGNLDLVKAVINRLREQTSENGIEISMHTDAPPGTGLGSSSALVVALIGLFREWHHLPLTDYKVADLAYQIERIDMAIKGGKQDQYAATFGGFNFIEFLPDTTIVNTLRIEPNLLNEFHYNLLLCYTGRPRITQGIIDAQIGNYAQKRTGVVEAMDELKQITIEMKNALLRGRLNDFGVLLHDAWINKKKMADQITTPKIDELYEVARTCGALGGKITGAGGGGYMFFYCLDGRKRHIAQALEQFGAQVIDFSFESHGLQTWRA